MSALAALARADLRVSVRDGEQLLLSAGLPLLLLVFFSTVDVLPTGDRPAVEFLVPGVVTVALLSTGLVRLAIGLGFDRSFGAITRYAMSPVTSRQFLASRAASAAAVATAQVAVLGAVGVALGWRPDLHPLVAVVILTSLVVFFGLGLSLGSVAEGLRSLALANAVYIVMLLVSGLVFELDALPDGLAAVVRLLPSTASAELLRSTTDGGAGRGGAWLVLAVWALAAPTLAVRTFRWVR